MSVSRRRPPPARSSALVSGLLSACSSASPVRGDVFCSAPIMPPRARPRGAAGASAAGQRDAPSPGDARRRRAGRARRAARVAAGAARERGWRGWRGRGRGPMPPSSSGALALGRLAHGPANDQEERRLSGSSGTPSATGRSTTSTGPDRIPGRRERSPLSARATVLACAAQPRARRGAELRHRVQLVHARGDLLAAQALDAARCRTPRR